jgi:hypothetical protein
VQGTVSAFGSGGGANSTIEDHIEVQNYTSIQLLKNFVRLGGRLRTSSQTNTSNGGSAGSITYSALLDPVHRSRGDQAADQLRGGRTTTPCAAANTAPGVDISSYQCGIPFQFSQTTIHQPTTSARETDVGLYAEDDWKITPNLTWSLGVRLEAQNYINSSHDFAPRTSIAWGVPRKNGKTTTVLRGGFGIFYDRFGLGAIENIVQNNPSNQSNITYTYPTSCTLTGADAATAGCTAGGGTSVAKTEVPVTGPGIRSPYTIESAATLEQQIGKYASVTVTYSNARGEHQELTRVFLATAGVCPTSITGATYILCNQSEGVYRQNQINTSINLRTPKGITVTGYYSLNWANSNLSGITDPFHPAFDYGRAGFAVRSRVSLGWHHTAAVPDHRESAALCELRFGPYSNLRRDRTITTTGSSTTVRRSPLELRRPMRIARSGATLSLRHGDDLYQRRVLHGDSGQLLHRAGQRLSQSAALADLWLRSQD